MRHVFCQITVSLLLTAVSCTNTPSIRSSFQFSAAQLPSVQSNIPARPASQNEAPTVIAAPTALPQTLGQHPVYVLDVLNGRLISELIGINADTQQAISTLTLRYVPDVLFAREGAKLYVLDSYYSRVTRGEWRDVLTVFNATTLEVETDDVLVPDRLKYKVFPIGNPWFLASPDGKYLFVGKYGKRDIHQLRLAVLDATTFEQLAEYPMPACNGGQLQVLKDSRLVCLIGNSLSAISPLTGATSPLVELSGGIPQLTLLSSKRERWYGLDQTGRWIVVDLAASPPRIVSETVRLELPADHTPGWLEQVVLSQGDSRLYLGLVPTSGELFGSGRADLIRVYDAETWRMIGEIKPDDPLRYLAISEDGTQLYLTSPEKRTLTIYDTTTFQEQGVVRDLGMTPSQILIPPK